MTAPKRLSFVCFRRQAKLRYLQLDTLSFLGRLNFLTTEHQCIRTLDSESAAHDSRPKFIPLAKEDPNSVTDGRWHSAAAHALPSSSANGSSPSVPALADRVSQCLFPTSSAAAATGIDAWWPHYAEDRFSGRDLRIRRGSPGSFPGLAGFDSHHRCQHCQPFTPGHRRVTMAPVLRLPLN